MRIHVNPARSPRDSSLCKDPDGWSLIVRGAPERRHMPSEINLALPWWLSSLPTNTSPHGTIPCIKTSHTSSKEHSIHWPTDLIWYCRIFPVMQLCLKKSHWGGPSLQRDGAPGSHCSHCRFYCNGDPRSTSASPVPFKALQLNVQRLSVSSQASVQSALQLSLLISAGLFLIDLLTHSWK